MALPDDLRRIAAAAEAHAAPGEELAGVVSGEPAGARLYLCAYRSGDDETTWLALDDAGAPVARRETVRELASIVAMCELAEEAAGGGDLDELRSQLVALRLTENPPGIDEADEAVLTLQRALGAPPRVATARYLDDVGAATRRLEAALGGGGGGEGPSPFAEAMRAGVPTVEEFAADVLRNYRLDLV